MCWKLVGKEIDYEWEPKKKERGCNAQIVDIYI